MKAKYFRQEENWNKSDFFNGEYDIDLESIDEYAEAYHQAKLKLLDDSTMKSENIKQLLLTEYKSRELSTKELETTLERYAKLYAQEQAKLIKT